MSGGPRVAGLSIRIPKALRAELADAIEAHLVAVEKLTALLDKVDGDPELEPSLGSPECVGYIPADAPGGPDFSQERWGRGKANDAEDEHDGPEPDADEEEWRGPVRLDTLPAQDEPAVKTVVRRRA